MRDPASPPPETAPDDPEATETLQALSDRERRFVLGLIRGESHGVAASAAGWRTTQGMLEVLGRPQVKRALVTLAPLLAVDPAGEARAREILRPYVLAALADKAFASGNAALHALRDLADGVPAPAGKAPGGKAARQAWEASRLRAATGQGQSDNADYGNPGSLPRA